MQRADEWNLLLRRMRADTARLVALACHTQMVAAHTVLRSRLARLRRTGEGGELEAALLRYRQARARWEQEDSYALVQIEEELAMARRMAGTRAAPTPSG